MRIANWECYQHYGTRCAPWIKIHRKLLHDRKWRALPAETARLFISRLEPQWLDRCGSRSGEEPQQATDEQTGNPEAASAGPEAGSPAPE